MQKLLSHVRRAVDEYAMINDGDRIAIGVSGGKDSLTLLLAMAKLRIFYPKKYEICAITLDMGFEGVDLSPIVEFCKQLDIEYTIKKTDLKEIIFDIRKEPNPCSLCAKMRRGALHDAALEHGCNKVALGHHKDDAIETFFLSLIYEGRINCFSPMTYLDRKDIYLIRPLLYTTEADIKGLVKRLDIPVVHNPCPANGYTKRQEIKDMLTDMSKEDRELKKRLFTAIQNSNIQGWTDRVMIGRKPII